MEMITTNNATGRRGKNRSAKIRSANAPNPIISVYGFVSPRCLLSSTIRVKKFPPPLCTPNSLGSWVEAMTNPAPTLNPLRIVSDTKLVIFPSRSAHAMTPMNPANTATAMAKCT